MKRIFVHRLLLAAFFLQLVPFSAAASIISLDGAWKTAPDPKNVGRDQKWWQNPTADSQAIEVPTIPRVTGVAWYWRDVKATSNPYENGRYLLRFWLVDYKADVWVNDVHIGTHTGGEEVFVMDATGAIKPNENNRIAVRVLKPAPGRKIDGIAEDDVPRARAGAWCNSGGILDSVEMLIVTPVWIKDLYVVPDRKTGRIEIQTTVQNTLKQTVSGIFTFSVGPAAGGETLNTSRRRMNLKPGKNLVKGNVRVDQPRLWELDDPYLYRVTARVSMSEIRASDEQTARCGFRDFVFKNGYFRLNGRRIMLNGILEGVDTHMSLEAPFSKAQHITSMIHMKAMGFNALRFHSSVARRFQLNLADEIGLLLSAACAAEYGTWKGEDSRVYKASYDALIMRDRNHPSIIMWELANEMTRSPLFENAKNYLPHLRKLDKTRIAMINSGRFDGYTRAAAKALGPAIWRHYQWSPSVTYNHKDERMDWRGSFFEPGEVSFHPDSRDPRLGFSCVRWTAPAAGKYVLSADFANRTSGGATASIHILLNRNLLFDSFIGCRGHGEKESFSKDLSLKKGDMIYAAVGVGEVSVSGDTVAIDLKIRSEDGKLYDVAKDFSFDESDGEIWGYGYLKLGDKPDTSTFKNYLSAPPEDKIIGSISNPGGTEWEDILSDQHRYPPVPYSADEIKFQRTLNGGNEGARHDPVIWSEGGAGHSQDLDRLMRLSEYHGHEWFKVLLDRFMKDWDRYNMADTFGTVREYFRQGDMKAAGERRRNLNAMRANHNFVGLFLTGSLDTHGHSLGLNNCFGEPRPGMMDAMYDVSSPIRWCLFVEPYVIYRNEKARFEVVLSNHDALKPGRYPVRIRVLDRNNKVVFDRSTSVAVADPRSRPEPLFTTQVFSEDAGINAPNGKCRFTVQFEKGAAATGGEVEFYVVDRAKMPPVKGTVALWGNDPELANWLSGNGIKCRRYNFLDKSKVILVSTKEKVDDKAFDKLLAGIKGGATAIFLSEGVFLKGNDRLGRLPLENKGELTPIGRQLWPADEWTKKHPIFSGLPNGKMMDYVFYRDIIPNWGFKGVKVPDEIVVACNNTSFYEYSSHILTGVYRLESGRFIINTLRIRDNLGKHPAAERILRNMLNYAAR